MTRIKYRIWVRTDQGTEMVAFHWNKSPEAGIARAWADAKLHDIKIVDAWAEPYVKLSSELC